MKKTQYFLFLLPAFFAFQCNDDDSPLINPYEGCCGNMPVEFTVGNAKLYVPSAFTPNGDGINDLFFPFFNDKVASIKTFQVSTPERGIMYVVFSSMNLQNPMENGWDGVDADGKKYAGLFNYYMTVTDDAGFLQTITGSACSILCDSFATVFKTKTDCFFPFQSDGNGGLDASLPHFEDTCFGN